MAPQRIVVTGVTGTQGGACARALLALGRFQVVGLVRDPSSAKARAIESRGVQLVRGDMEDIESLHRAFAGAYGVFSVQQPFAADFSLNEEAEIRQGRNVAQAARAAGVRHIVYTSAIGSGGAPTGVPHLDSKTPIEHEVRASGVPFTILRPVTFFDNWLAPAGPMALKPCPRPRPPRPARLERAAGARSPASSTPTCPGTTSPRRTSARSAAGAPSGRPRGARAGRRRSLAKAPPHLYALHYNPGGACLSMARPCTSRARGAYVRRARRVRARTGRTAEPRRANPQQFVGRAIDIAGDIRTGPQLADSLARTFGQPFEYELYPLFMVKLFAREFGLMREWFEKDLVRIDLNEMRRIVPNLLRAEDVWRMLDPAAAERLRHPAPSSCTVM